MEASEEFSNVELSPSNRLPLSWENFDKTKRQAIFSHAHITVNKPFKELKILSLGILRRWVACNDHGVWFGNFRSQSLSQLAIDDPVMAIIPPPKSIIMFVPASKFGQHRLEEEIFSPLGLKGVNGYHKAHIQQPLVNLINLESQTLGSVFPGSETLIRMSIDTMTTVAFAWGLFYLVHFPVVR